MHFLYFALSLAQVIRVNGSPVSPRSVPYLPERLIALEEHAVSPSFEADTVASGIDANFPGIVEKLKDVGKGRLAAMDDGHLSLMVLSQQSPVGIDDPKGCIESNNYMRGAIAANSKRFAGFATLPLATPDQAAAELERSVKDLGFKGAMIWNHLNDGVYFDNGRFDAIFAKAQELDVPLYLHPSPPTKKVFNLLFEGDYIQSTSGSALSQYSWGWHVDVGTHVLRLYSAGIFDRFPKLKIILGHNGEGLPMFIDRIDQTRLRSDTTFAHVWKTNIWATTSGFLTVRAFKQLQEAMPIEKIMYSVDYPFADMNAGWQFVKDLAEQKILTNEEMDLFAYKNAEKLLRL